jgi:hypothetical protein
MTKFNRSVAALLAVLVLTSTMPREALAGMLATPTRSDAREQVAQFLSRDDVAARLEAYGASAAEVQGRVAAMTDEEAALVAARIDELPAGGVLGLIVTVFLVLLITDILGLTKVFPFTKPICDRGKC